MSGWGCLNASSKACAESIWRDYISRCSSRFLLCLACPSPGSCLPAETAEHQHGGFGGRRHRLQPAGCKFQNIRAHGGFQGGYTPGTHGPCIPPRSLCQWFATRKSRFTNLILQVEHPSGSGFNHHIGELVSRVVVVVLNTTTLPHPPHTHSFTHRLAQQHACSATRSLTNTRQHAHSAILSISHPHTPSQTAHPHPSSPPWRPNPSSPPSRSSSSPPPPSPPAPACTPTAPAPTASCTGTIPTRARSATPSTAAAAARPPRPTSPAAPCTRAP